MKTLKIAMKTRFWEEADNREVKEKYAHLGYIFGMFCVVNLIVFAIKLNIIMMVINGFGLLSSALIYFSHLAYQKKYSKRAY